LLNLLLFVLTVGACFALFQAVWRDQATVANRLRGEAETQRRISGKFSALIEQTIDRWPAGSPAASPAERALSTTLTYAGFRGAKAKAMFQLARAALMIGLTLIGIALAASIGKSVLGIGAMGCALGYIVPTLAVRRIATARQRRIKAELPDVLVLLCQVYLNFSNPAV
jgi:Flp pilus assembly protein TadB